MKEAIASVDKRNRKKNKHPIATVLTKYRVLTKSKHPIYRLKTQEREW